VRLLVLVLAALSCWGIGCSRGATNVPTTAFLPTDAPLFDHSVDFVEAPVIVEGGWRGEFERRVDRADLVAAVRATSSVAEVVKRSSALRITVRVDERFKGASDRDIELRVDDDQPSFGTVEDSEQRILRDPWIVFIKWETVEGESDLVPRWHLSPDTPEVRAKIDYLLSAPPPDPNTQVEVIEP
jgi:hypothetical protein